jgi:hypothetical protein
MILDNVLAEIITQTQKELKAKYDIELPFEEVVDIIDIQLTATSFAFSRNVSIYWKGFLKFIWTDRRNRATYKKELFSTVADKELNLTDKEREYYHYLARVEANSKYKELESFHSKTKPLTAEEVKNLPTKSLHFFNFKPLLVNRKK